MRAHARETWMQRAPPLPFMCVSRREGGKKNVRRNVQGRTGRLPVVHGCLSSRCPQCAVQVKLELGHRAQVRKKPTVEGFTHDWMVFVRGPEHSNIQHFVEKVVFHLHESFPRPKRGRARVQKELDKKCLCRRREQSLGPAVPCPSPCSSPCLSPRPPSRARPRSLGTRVRGAALARSGLPPVQAASAARKSPKRKHRQVSSVYSSPASPHRSSGVSRGFCGKGAISCWVWGVGLEGINSLSSPPPRPQRNG